MTINPQVGDIWEFKKGELEPITVLLTGEKIRYYNVHPPRPLDSRTFYVIPLDFNNLDHVSFHPHHEHYWRKLA